MKVAFLLIPLAFGTSGCEMALARSIAPTVNASGHWGVEARIEGNASMGNEKAHAQVTVAQGGGYSSSVLGGYYVASPEIAAQMGPFPSNTLKSPFVRASASALYSARVSTGLNVHHGVGGAVQVLFGPRGRGPWLLGPRFQTEYVSGMDKPRDRWLFMMPFVVKWIAFDTPYAY